MSDFWHRVVVFTHVLGSMSEPASLWEQEQQRLEQYTHVVQARIAALKRHGIRAVVLPIPGCECTHTHYLNAKGQRMIANSTQTEWRPAADFCPACHLVLETVNPGYHQSCSSNSASPISLKNKGPARAT